MLPWPMGGPTSGVNSVENRGPKQARKATGFSVAGESSIPPGSRTSTERKAPPRDGGGELAVLGGDATAIARLQS